jgi:hypothetical protein
MDNRRRATGYFKKGTGYGVRGMGKNNVMRLCPVPPLRNEDARHVLRDGTVMQVLAHSS